MDVTLTSLRAESQHSWHPSDSEPDEDAMEDECEEDDEELPSFQHQSSVAEDVVMVSPRQGGNSTTTPHADIRPLVQQTGSTVSQGPSPSSTMPVDGAATQASSSGPSATVSPELPIMDEWTILECATVWNNLQMPLEEPPTDRGQGLFLGQDPSPAPAPRMKKLPMATGFDRALHASWRKHEDPQKMCYAVDFDKSAEVGIPTCPPLDLLLAQTFSQSLKDSVKETAKKGGPFSLGVVPGFTDATERYRAAALSARSLNAAAILQGSVRTMIRGVKDKIPPDVAAELDMSMKMMIHLNVHAIQWAGRAMDIAMQQERSRWLDKVTLVGAAGTKANNIMQGLPGNPVSLIAGGLELLRESVESQKATKEILEATTQPQSERQGRSRSSRQKERGHAPSRHGKSGYSSSRPPSFSGGSKPRSQVSVVRREDNRPPPRAPKLDSSHKARGKGRVAYRRDRRPVREAYDEHLSSQREVTYQRVVNVVERRTTTNRLEVEYDRGYDDDQRYYSSRNAPDQRGYRGENTYLPDDRGYMDDKQFSSMRPISQLEDGPYMPPRDDGILRRQVEISRPVRDRPGPYVSSRGQGLSPLMVTRMSDRGDNNLMPSHPHTPRGDDYDDNQWREREFLNTSRDRSPPSRREAQTSVPLARSASGSRSYTPERDTGSYTYQQLQQRRYEESIGHNIDRENPRVPATHTPSGSAAGSPPRGSMAVQEDLPASVKEPEDDVMVVGSTEPKLTPQEDLKARRAKAITAKAFEIEKLYRQDCETFGTVVKMLANKEPALEPMLAAPLRDNLLEIKQRCLDDLSHFIKELDQAMELDQAVQPSDAIAV